MPKGLTLKQIADRLSAHLHRIEQDPVLNPWLDGPMSTKAYYRAWAMVHGRYVGVRYVSYQGVLSLTKTEAIQYLAWLDAGHNGKHFSMLREETPV